MTAPVDALSEVFARIRSLRPEIGVALVDAGPDDPLSAFGSDRQAVADWLAAEKALFPGLDDKAAAAFIAGRLGYLLAGFVLLLRVMGGYRIAADAGAVAVRRGSAEAPGSMRIEVRRSAVAASTDPATDTRLALEVLFAAVVPALSAGRLLGRRALWRLFADAVASAYLEVGRSVGQEALFRAEALAILRHTASPLSNPQTDFVDITVPADGPCGEACRCFVARGGCCLWHTVPGEEKCITCVLRTPDDRKARLAAYLASTLQSVAT